MSGYLQGVTLLGFLWVVFMCKGGHTWNPINGTPWRGGGVRVVHVPRYMHVPALNILTYLLALQVVGPYIPTPTYCPVIVQPHFDKHLEAIVKSTSGGLIKYTFL